MLLWSGVAPWRWCERALWFRAQNTRRARMQLPTCDVGVQRPKVQHRQGCQVGQGGLGVHQAHAASARLCVPGPGLGSHEGEGARRTAAGAGVH